MRPLSPKEGGCAQAGCWRASSRHSLGDTPKVVRNIRAKLEASVNPHRRATAEIGSCRNAKARSLRAPSSRRVRIQSPSDNAFGGQDSVKLPHRYVVFSGNAASAEVRFLQVQLDVLHDSYEEGGLERLLARTRRRRDGW